MRIIALYSQKGGCGKTTITVHLAVAAHLAGESVAILDADPQRSAESWAAERTQRGEYMPPVACVTPANIDDALDAARNDGVTFCLIDNPPRASADAGRLLAEVDGVLIPVRPSAFDLSALHRTVEIIAAAGKPFAAILNACPLRAPEIAEARTALAQNGIPVLAQLNERRAYSRAVSSGRAVMEFEPEGKAAEEVAGLWRAMQ